MDATTLSQCTGSTLERASVYAQPLTDAMNRFDINTRERVACFLATVAIESARLKAVEEGLYYTTAERLCAVYPSMFVASKGGKYRAEDFVKNPAHFSKVRYEGYHGRGLIQLTWVKNYEAASTALGFNYVARPELVLQPEHAALTAAWYFAVHGACLPAADRCDMTEVTKRVNGSAMLHLAERKAQMDVVLKVLT